MDPKGSFEWIEALLPVAVFVTAGLAISFSVWRNTRAKRDTAGNGDSGSAWDGDSSDCGGDGGGD